MENQNVRACDCYIGVDRMINEGLGGGYLSRKYSEKQLEVVGKGSGIQKSTRNDLQEREGDH